MKTYILKLDIQFEVEADTEEEAFEYLEERFAIENRTAENEFWDNMEITELKNGKD